MFTAKRVVNMNINVMEYNAVLTWPGVPTWPGEGPSDKTWNRTSDRTRGTTSPRKDQGPESRGTPPPHGQTDTCENNLPASFRANVFNNYALNYTDKL